MTEDSRPAVHDRRDVSAESLGRPTRVRHLVLAWICSLSVITYLDRVSIAGSAPYISEELGMTPVQMGMVFSAFAIAYAAFEVPGGWLADRIGPRKVITRIVVWWSIFTVITGLVHRLWSLIVVRFLFGAGEAGMYPNAAKVFSSWAPSTERGFVSGMMWMWARLGGAFAPGLVVYLIAHTGWRPTFWIFGSIGIVWAVFFWFWFRDTPREKSGVNQAELRLIEAGGAVSAPAHSHLHIRWGRFLRNGNLWAICWMYFCFAYGWYFYITWLPTYLKAKGASMMQAGIYGGMPLLFGAVGSVLGGLLTDYVVKKTGNLKNRRYIGAASFALGSGFMVSSAWLDDPLSAVLAISMASFFGDLTLSSCWAVCMDVGHELAGTVSAFMNMWGNFAGFIFPAATGLMVQRFQNWDLPVVVSGVIFFGGALLWLRIDPTQSVLKDPEPARA